MGSYGVTTLQGTGRLVMASADGAPEWKTGGITIDWTKVPAAVTNDATIAGDGTLVKAGDQYLRYGQVVAKITTGGKFGVHDTSASDGRQTLANGNCFIVNTTVLKSEVGSDHPPVFGGGKAWEDRLLIGNGTNVSTIATLLGAMPRLFPVRD
jgi:hypothetical protein